MEETLALNIRAILKRYHYSFLEAVFFVLVSNFFTLANPFFFRQAVMAMDPQSGIAEGLFYHFLLFIFGQYYTSIWVWAILLLTIALFAAYFKYKMRICFIAISREAECSLRGEVFKRVQEQSGAFYDRYDIGELLSRLTNDISIYRDVLGPGIMYPIYGITLVIPGVIALMTISKPMALLSLLPIIFIPIINRGIRKVMYSLSLAIQRQLGSLSGMVQEMYSGIRIVKGYGIEGATAERFNAGALNLAVDTMKLSNLQGLLYPFFALLTKVTTVLLVLLAGAIILQGWSTLSTADFVSFMWIQSYIYIPILMLGWVLPVYQRGRAAYDRVLQVYKEPIEVKDSIKSDLSIPDRADIIFSHLYFTYPGESKQALIDINFTIKGGSFVGITGAVGAGKTTLFKLIDREYEVPRGMITIGGKDVHDYPLSAFHQQIVTVEQTPFLFSKSIEDNVMIGRMSATKEDVERAARYADLHDTVAGFPEKYDTLVGERGVTLSGGQKQRVAIARAFLVDRSILLLDDLFSAVDTSTERQIFESLIENFQGRTVLLITHRASILNKMDRVIVMKDGAVIEDGTPETLKKTRGHFWALLELQNLGLEEGGIE